MRILYSLIIQLYIFVIKISSLWNNKAKLWIEGRRNWKTELTKIPHDKKVFWVHCASLGEFEQGRPIIEMIKQNNPEIFILLTFFSPSGYEQRKNYDKADLVMYMPADTISNAKYFVKHAHPTVAIFVKYEFWFNFIKQLYLTQIKLFSISTIFRDSQLFFNPFGKWFLKHLNYFTHLFVQTNESKNILINNKITQVSVSGDTRYDRVYQIASNVEPVEIFTEFAKNNFTIVAGSTWLPDHELLAEFINKSRGSVKFIVAPHEIGERNIKKLESLLTVSSVRLSKVSTIPAEVDVVIIDSIGLLNKVYQFADVAYIGGGFGVGIHNVLEPAVFGVPVVFGPKYSKFFEAREMVDKKIGFSINNYVELNFILNKFIYDNETLKQHSDLIKKFIADRLGASNMIFDGIINNKYV